MDDATGEAINFSFTAEVQCDKSITGQGNAKVISADYTTDPCLFKVVVAHDAGCPTVDGSGFANFMDENPWILGIVMLVCGPVVAMCGKRFFPWVTAGIAAIFVGFGLLIFFSAFEWMSGTAGLVICLIVAIGLAAVAAYFVFKMVWVGIGMLGIVGGYFLGTMIYTFFLASFHWSALWAMITFSIVFAILGGLVAFKFSKWVVLLSTSGIGSYAFMRGWSMFLGGFPTESEMMADLQSGEDLDLTWAFWVYFALFIGGWIGSTIWQYKKEPEHESIKNDEYYNRA